MPKKLTGVSKQVDEAFKKLNKVNLNSPEIRKKLDDNARRLDAAMQIDPAVLNITFKV